MAESTQEWIKTEKTFEELKMESLDLLLKSRELSTLLDILKEVEELEPCIDCKNEYSYLETNAEYKLCRSIIDIIKNKIEKLK